MTSDLLELGRFFSFKRLAGAGTEPRPPEEPLIDELFSVGQLERHARVLAERHEVDPRRRRGAPVWLLSRLVDNAATLKEGYGLITEALKQGTRITYAAEWFIDNYHLIEEEVRTAQRHLPPGYSRELPQLVRAVPRGTPRVYDIAIELVSHSHGRLDLEGLRAFVASYQAVTPLLLGELWAIPIMLRLALIENLRRVVDSVTAGRRDCSRASFWVDRMMRVATANPGQVVLALADMVKENPPLTPPFVAELVSRLRGQGPALAFPISWIEQRLGEQGQTLDRTLHLVGQAQAADQVSVSNSIGSLRLLGASDWRAFVEALSVVETTLRAEPSGTYPQMDFATRDQYRRGVEAVAKRSPLSEAQVASAALDLARQGAGVDSPGAAAAEGSGDLPIDVGHFLIGDGRPRLEAAAQMRPSLGCRLDRAARGSPLKLYGGAIAAITCLVTALLAHAAAPFGVLGRPGLIALVAVLAIASSQLAVGLVNGGFTLLLEPRILPRLDFSSGIPAWCSTVVAVPTLLTDPDEIAGLLESLEVQYLANRDRHLWFALLSDLRDAPQQNVEGDEALVALARAGIESLNEKYALADRPGPFLLLHRARRWNPGQRAWMGWERKRGKLQALNETLRGSPGRFDLAVGDVELLRGARYVITLDSDTQLPRDAARLLVGTAAHPLNRPRFDQRAGRVTRGYTLFQPRVATTMASTWATRFARLFAGSPGIDPYSRAVSDLYQDLFGEGSFIGKGLYDVAAFQRSLGGQFPDNRILSHDLLEGAYARCGLVSDVVVYDDYPAAYTSDISRRSRWMRGDWQIARWLSGRVPGPEGHAVRNPLSPLSRWKVLDNLRRSLVPPCLLLLVLGAWATRGAAALSLLVVGTVVLLPGSILVLAELARGVGEASRRHRLAGIGRALVLQILRDAYGLACLPYEALIALSAILVTAWRLLITHRNLLEWRTAGDDQRGLGATLAGHHAGMWVGPGLGVSALAAMAMREPNALPEAVPLVALWILAPSLAWWLSRPRVPRASALEAQNRRFLRRVARRTWGFFEAFVTAEDNHLPVDNFQEDPPRGAAHRTSPTNIGLALTANLAAYDFGYLTATGLAERTRLTIDSAEKLQRYRGHLLNWYDTRTLEPLQPPYVSTVDSGNLSGHLATLAAGLRGIANQGIVREQTLEGLLDPLDLVEELAPGAATVIAELAVLRGQLADPSRTLPELRRRLESLSAPGSLERVAGSCGLGAEASSWIAAFRRQARAALEQLVWLAPWTALPPPSSAGSPQGGDLSLPTGVPTWSETVALANELAPMIDRRLAGPSLQDPPTASLRELRDAVVVGSARAAEHLQALAQLAQRCEELSDLDYGFLYDRERHLLSIGYNLTTHRLDPAFYDLLASEARLTSFVAIAQGKLPLEHWFRLGRLQTTTGGRPALLSWSGSMFEYLMPLLIMPTYPATLLDETYRAVVERQIEYGRERGVCWGVSESGYNKTDLQQNYQYRAFGVPGLGFKRGLAGDLVIAPYASAMGLMVEPRQACANLRRLAIDGLVGHYGFYEAVDYTPERLPPGVDRVVIRSHMAHHQGMTLLALAYALLARPMQRRFAECLAFRATDLLLQERVPRDEFVYPHPAELAAAYDPAEGHEAHYRVYTTPNTPTPAVHLLSNGSYHVAITNAGAGYSRWRDLALTRWREDPTRDAWGSFCYLRDLGSDSFWSVAHQPSLVPAASYEVIYSQGRAEIRRRDGDIQAHLEIVISPEDDIELRRVTLRNLGRTPRTLELTSYAEVVLAPPMADDAHPALNNLFVETEILPAARAILCTRRPRSGTEAPPWMIHMMIVQGAPAGKVSYETGREQFVGRGRSLRDPAALHRPDLTNSQGSVLDPIVAIRSAVTLEPDGSAEVQIVTGAAQTRPGALALMEKYNDRHVADRVFGLSLTHSHVVMQQVDATEAQVQMYEELASHVLYSSPILRAPRSVIASNRRGQSALWAHGISGDLPIVLLRVTDRAQMSLVRELVKAHAYWRLKGLIADLVIWNEEIAGYRQALQDEILVSISAQAGANLLDQRGGIFVRNRDQLSEEDKVLIQTVARLVLSDSDGPLAEQLRRRLHVGLPPLLVPARRRPIRQGFRPSVEAPPPPARRPDLVGFNGLGGFTQDGREYVISTSRGHRTPAPWVNVLANPWFGTVVSESGGAYTWCENAQTYRLTPWTTDPVGDASGEAFYLRDESDGRFWSPTPLPASGSGPYTTRHGFGYTAFEHTEDGIFTELRTFVATDAPLKFVLLKVRNSSGRARQLSVTGYVELVLGSQRPINLPHIVTEVDPGSGGLLARNPYSSEFGARIAFFDCSEKNRTVSGDRTELIGRNGTLADPLSMERVRLSGHVGAGLDPCMAMQAGIELADGQEREVAFTFGSGRDLPDARALLQRFKGLGAARAALEGVWAYWKRALTAVTVRTPDPSVDVLVNGWLMYQVLACRVWGRSGFYQSGGAFGFRDQLQDAMALVHAEPAILREQILRAAGRQFEAGDVQHWWHPPTGRGVRTRISDDYLWLPYAVCRYVTALGDTGVLDEKVGFLEGRSLRPEEDSYYDLPGRSEDSASLYDHCVRAIENGLRFGRHGLPLMGSGDWNDGMNLVGGKGRGESVWLAFFLFDVLQRFSGLSRERGDLPFAERCLSEAARLRDNIEANGWDGEWYRRAYFDGGLPLGSSENAECQIDSLPQSWSVLSGAGSPERARQALRSLDRRLVRQDLALIQLFDPPFETSDLEPGYVRGYPPGVRENGGQYTHAAIWAAMAFATAGDGSRAWELFNLINPVRHGDSPAGIARYKVEPYVVAADVYSSPQHPARGGWTWYTGSAAWMYRLITESLLGLRLERGRLRVEPTIPPPWRSFEIDYRHHQATYRIRVVPPGPDGTGEARVTCDGIEQPDGSILLESDSREHRVEVAWGAPQKSMGCPT